MSNEMQELRDLLKGNLYGDIRPDQILENLIWEVVNSTGDEVKTLAEEETGPLAHEAFGTVPNSPDAWRAFYAGQLQAITRFARAKTSKEAALRVRSRVRS